MKNIKEQVVIYINKAASVILVAGSLVLGFGIGYYFHILDIINDKSVKVENLKTNKEVRIAIDEANQLIIMDKNTGSYQMYSDTVGRTIFNMYAKQIVAQ
jgi:hypothetical protein